MKELMAVNDQERHHNALHIARGTHQGAQAHSPQPTPQQVVTKLTARSLSLIMKALGGWRAA